MSALPFPSAGLVRLIARTVAKPPFARFGRTHSHARRLSTVHPHQAGNHLARPATNAGRPVRLHLRDRLSFPAVDRACVVLTPIVQTEGC